MNLRLLIISICALLLSFSVDAQTYSLAQCKEMVLQNNARMKNQHLDVAAAKEVKKAAYTKYFPQVSATAFAYRFTDPLINMEMTGGDLPVYDGNPANLQTASQFAYFPGAAIPMFKEGAIGIASATQPIYAGQRISTGNRLANLGIEVSEIQLIITEKELLLETEKKFWQIILLGEKMETLAKYINLVDTLHKDVFNAWEAGMITQNDLLKVKLKQNELQMNLNQLTNGIELAKMAFCQYIGVDYSENLNFVDDVEINKTPELYYINHLDALQNREEYMLLQRSSDAEKYMTKMQRGEYLPEIAVGVGALYLDVMGNSGNGVGMAFGTISIPISGWWEAKHKMKERHIKEEQNRNMVNDTNEKLLLQMQQGRNMLNEAHKQLLLAKISIEQADENLRINQNSFEAGIVNVSEVLDAQAQLHKSRNDYTEALMQYQIASVYYLQITGR